MFLLDIGDHSSLGLEVKKAAGVLTSLGYEITSLSLPRAAELGNPASDDEGWILSGAIENPGGHRAGGGLTVSSRHGETAPFTHQLAEKLRVFQDRDSQPASLANFRIVVTHRRRMNEKINIGAEVGLLVNGRVFHSKPLELQG